MRRNSKPYFMSFLVVACMVVLCAAVEQVMAVPIVHTSDFIADGTRTHFNGFESIPVANNNVNLYDGGDGPYTEDTIQVQQINGDPDINGESIWATNLWKQGNFGWYPNGGDNGYTELSFTGGEDFVDVGFNFFRGNGYNAIFYELRDGGSGGSLVLAGEASFGTGINDSYLGFEGGGFDTILLRSGTSGSTTFYDGTLNTLVIDSIETQGQAETVPEPATFALLGIGLAGLAGAEVRRRRKKKTVDKS